MSSSALRRRHRSRHDQQRRRLRARRTAATPIARAADSAARRRPARSRRAPLLPSFLYLPAAASCRTRRWRCRGSDGRRRRRRVRAQRGSEVPDRLVASAKSWLSYGGVDRTARDPAVGQPGRRAASSRRSTRRRATWPTSRAAWNARVPDAPLAEQDVLLTVPASFDPVARELTVRAAADAGLAAGDAARGAAGGVLRLDRRQRRGAGATQVQVGDVVLVCDVGGGTTDFTLIAVREEGGSLALERVAVGDHILLGGDNMDLALAYRAARAARRSRARARRLAAARPGRELPRRQGAAARRRPPSRALPIAILGRGRKVVGGALRAEVARADVERGAGRRLLPALRARRPPAGASAAPACRSSACRTPPIRRHPPPRAFPRAASADAAAARARPRCCSTAASCAPRRCAQRLLDVLERLVRAAAAVRVLAGGDPEHAVARGAAYYGLARRGRGVRIRGGIGAHVSTRHRDRDAGRARHAPADQGAVRRAARHGGRQRGRAAGAGVRPGRRRAGRVPLPELVDPPRRSRRHAARDVGRRRDRGAGAAAHRRSSGRATKARPCPVHLQARVNEVGVLELLVRQPRRRSAGSSSSTCARQRRISPQRHGDAETRCAGVSQDDLASPRLRVSAVNLRMACPLHRRHRPRHHQLGGRLRRHRGRASGASPSFADPAAGRRRRRVAERPTLPSFLYLAGEHDVAPGALALPWDAERGYAVGEFARAQGARVPGRLVTVGEVVALPRRRRPRSGDPAVGGAGRRAASCRRSTASARYLAAHPRGVGRSASPTHRWRRRTSCSPCRPRSTRWRASSPSPPPQQRRAAARHAARGAAGGVLRLARRARGRLAGAPRPTCTSRWSSTSAAARPTSASSASRRDGERLGARTPRGRRSPPARRRQHRPRPGAPARAAARREARQPALARAHQSLPRRQGDAARPPTPPATCRSASPDAAAPSSAARCSATLTRERGRARWCSTASSRSSPADALPRTTPRAGLQEWGLPFAAEPEVSRHLAAFLAPARRRPTWPTATRQPRLARRRAVQRRRADAGADPRRACATLLASWNGGRPPTVLESASLDLAVARGAAYYGLVRRGLGVRIGGGSARAYYLGLAPTPRPRRADMRRRRSAWSQRGMHEGEEVEITDARSSPCSPTSR